MNFEFFDADALRRMRDEASRLGSDADAHMVPEVARRYCAVLLATQQAAIEDANIAYAAVEAARDGDGAYVAEMLTRWRQALDRARQTSTHVTAALRRMLTDTAAGSSAALPHLQAATAMSMASVAELERRCRAPVLHGAVQQPDVRSWSQVPGRHRRDRRPRFNTN